MHLIHGAILTSSPSRIRVTTASNITHEGVLYTADPVTSLLILQTSPSTTSTSTTSITPSTPACPPGSYHLFPISQIQSFTILSPASITTDSSTSTPSPATLDIPSLTSRLQTAITAAHTTLARQGPKGTSPVDQALFDALARTHPARWEGQSMVVSDSFVIEKPYSGANTTYWREGEKGSGGADASSGGFKGDLERFRKVVDMELSKAVLRVGKVGLDRGVRKGG